MLVNDWMNAPAITVDVNDNMQRAVNLMMKHKIDHLPVLDEGKLVGMVTDKDLQRAAPPDIAAPGIKDILYHMPVIKVQAIMSRNPVTVRPDFTLEEAADVMLEKNLSGCPVLGEDDQLVGIITKNDLFRAMIAVSGVKKRGVQFGFLLEDKAGSIKEVTDIIRRYNARLVSINATYSRAPEGFRYVYIRAFRVDRKTLPQLKKELDAAAKLLYMVDLRDGVRETYAAY